MVFVLWFFLLGILPSFVSFVELTKIMFCCSFFVICFFFWVCCCLFLFICGSFHLSIPIDGQHLVVYIDCYLEKGFVSSLISPLHVKKHYIEYIYRFIFCFCPKAPHALLDGPLLYHHCILPNTTIFCSCNKITIILCIFVYHLILSLILITTINGGPFLCLPFCHHFTVIVLWTF